MAWAAGLFEGEGSIMFSGSHRNVRLRVAMTDGDVLREYARVVGVGTVRFTESVEGRKDVWTWQTTRASAVIQVLGQFWPYLGDRRRQRAVEALERAAKSSELMRRYPEAVQHEPHDEQAWAAGLFEAEGCIAFQTKRIDGQRASLSPHLILRSCDFDVVDRFARVTGCGYVAFMNAGDKARWPARHRPWCDWRTGVLSEVADVLGRWYPYFGHRRGEKCTEALERIGLKDRA